MLGLLKVLLTNLCLFAENKSWAAGKGDHFEAVAAYDFEGMADRELKIKSGQKIFLAPASCQPSNVKGWVLASDGTKIGLVPTNYIKILGRRSGKVLDNPQPKITSNVGNTNRPKNIPTTLEPIPEAPTPATEDSSTEPCS